MRQAIKILINYLFYERYTLGKLLILAIFAFVSVFRINPPKMPHEYISLWYT